MTYIIRLMEGAVWLEPFSASAAAIALLTAIATEGVELPEWPDRRSGLRRPASKRPPRSILLARQSIHRHVKEQSDASG